MRSIHILNDNNNNNNNDTIMIYEKRSKINMISSNLRKD